MIDNLELDPKNEREHKSKNISAIKSSLDKFGQQKPVVIDEKGKILAGHGMVMAAKDLGWKTVSCVRSSLKGKAKSAYRVADNKTSDLSDWNAEALAWTLNDIGNEFQMKDFGFDQSDWGMPDMPEPRDDDDVVPEVDDNIYGVERGDIWQLGDHRLMCGDSTDESDVLMLMDDNKGKLCVTDPPYGIAYVENANTKNQAKKHKKIENDDLDGEKLQKFLEKCIKNAAKVLNKNSAYYLWHPMLTQGTFFAAAAAAAADILISRQIVWVKPSLVFGRGDYHWQHELCFYGWIRGHKPNFYGARNQTTIWNIGRENDKIHPTQKPVMIYEIPIKNHTEDGDLLYEPFGGSGSVFIACEKTKRKVNAMEIDPVYCSVIIKRWEDYTGKKSRKHIAI